MLCRNLDTSAPCHLSWGHGSLQLTLSWACLRSTTTCLTPWQGQLGPPSLLPWQDRGASYQRPNPGTGGLDSEPATEVSHLHLPFTRLTWSLVKILTGFSLQPSVWQFVHRVRIEIRATTTNDSLLSIRQTGVKVAVPFTEAAKLRKTQYVPVWASCCQQALSRQCFFYHMSQHAEAQPSSRCLGDRGRRIADTGASYTVRSRPSCTAQGDFVPRTSVFELPPVALI